MISNRWVNSRLKADGSCKRPCCSLFGPWMLLVMNCVDDGVDHDDVDDDIVGDVDHDIVGDVDDEQDHYVVDICVDVIGVESGEVVVVDENDDNDGNVDDDDDDDDSLLVVRSIIIVSIIIIMLMLLLMMIVLVMSRYCVAQ